LFRIPDLPIEIKCYKNNCGYLIKYEILVRMKAIIIFSKRTYSYWEARKYTKNIKAFVVWYGDYLFIFFVLKLSSKYSLYVWLCTKVTHIEAIK
jgi:hypothetical protein